MLKKRESLIKWGRPLLQALGPYFKAGAQRRYPIASIGWPELPQVLANPRGASATIDNGVDLRGVFRQSVKDGERKALG
jgi:hypothetical protein